MKVIAGGGITSKNVPPNSKDAVLLTMYSNFASGLAFNVYYTKDKQIIVSDEDQVGIMTNRQTSLEDTHSNEILKHNIGSKVTTHQPMLLEEALSLYKGLGSNKIFLLKIDGLLLENNNFMNDLVEIVKQYPIVEIYILSDNVNRLLYLSSLNTKARIGVSVTNRTMSNLNQIFDFYALDHEVVTQGIVDKIFEANRAIFIDDVNTVNDLNKITSTLTEAQNRFIYIITQNYGIILSNI